MSYIIYNLPFEISGVFLHVFCSFVVFLDIHFLCCCRYPPVAAYAAESESNSGGGDSCQCGVHQTCGATGGAE